MKIWPWSKGQFTASQAKVNNTVLKIRNLNVDKLDLNAYHLVYGFVILSINKKSSKVWSFCLVPHHFVGSLSQCSFTRKARVNNTAIKIKMFLGENHYTEGKNCSNYSLCNYWRIGRETRYWDSYGNFLIGTYNVWCLCWIFLTQLLFQF